MNLQEMRSALKGQNRDSEAIFWFGLFWNAGATSDLYRAMCDTNYDPSLYLLWRKSGSNEILTPANDPEILYCHRVLMDQYKREHPENFDLRGRPIEFPLHPIKYADIKENDVVIHGPGRPFACIESDWPCRVFTWHGDLGVPCA